MNMKMNFLKNLIKKNEKYKSIQEFCIENNLNARRYYRINNSECEMMLREAITISEILKIDVYKVWKEYND